MFKGVRWFLLIAISCSAGFGAESPVIRGTINVVLANANGIVALTDSRLSAFTQSGPRPLLRPGQKLFQLDDVTVCTFAGFAEAPLRSFPELTSNSAGILQDIRRQLSNYPRHSFRAKLLMLSFVFQMQLETIASVSEISEGASPPGLYRIELTLVGYDTDGIPKIGQVHLRVGVVDYGGSQFLRAEADRIEELTVGKELVWELGGQKTTARLILAAAALEQSSQDPAIADFARAYTLNRGTDLTIEQMKKLAIALARYTAMNSRTVGGANQIATLEGGKLTGMQQGSFPEQPPMRHFVVFIEPGFYRGLAGIVGSSALVIKGRFENITRQGIDGNFFFGTDFVNTQIIYDGGTTRFDSTNHVTDCVLSLGPNANRNPEFVRHLLTDFKWKNVVGGTPPAQVGATHAEN